MARQAHWIRRNHQERMPPRMVAFDTESRSVTDNDTEIQTWRIGCAIRWRNDTKVSDNREARVFQTPEDFWLWVADFCRPHTRTVVWAHNLGYDVRISRMFEILPALGFHLEWCNLDRNISSATWRSPRGTIVLADSWTWIPLPLSVIAGQCGTVKYDMPKSSAPLSEWARYCMQDCEILYRVVGTLMQFVQSAHLGNWQPTGAGMAYATWRHKFLQYNVLVHDDSAAIDAERHAMHTGRAEAWRHGKVHNEKWTEIDLKNAYVTVASRESLPRKLHMHSGALSHKQYLSLRDRFAILAKVSVHTDTPCVPYKAKSHHLWPTGAFETWLWDCEVDLAVKYGAKVKILDSYAYVRDPILQDWANWTLGILYDDSDAVSGIVRTHVKHCARALIGRIALRVPSWEYFGANIENITGITYMVMPEEGRTARMLHVGEDTLVETSREEGKDSLPMVTGYIMARVRCILWDAMNVAGLGNLAHVDTDSILVNGTGLARMRSAMAGQAISDWALKGTYTDLEIWGPRAYWRDRQRVAAGMPLRGEETAPGQVTAWKWSGLAADLERREGGSVTLTEATWHMRRNDPRRADAAGIGGATRAYDVAELASPKMSSDAENSGGE